MHVQCGDCTAPLPHSREFRGVRFGGGGDLRKLPLVRGRILRTQVLKVLPLAFQLARQQMRVLP